MPVAKKACPQCGKMVAGNNVQRHLRNVHGIGKAADPIIPDEVIPPAGEDEPLDPDSAFSRSETSPAGPTGGKWWKGGKKKPGAKKARSSPSRRRTNSAELFGMIWDQAGEGLVVTGRDIPLGRVLQMQAPWVGEAVDDAIKGTLVDALVQPFARMQAKGGKLGAVVLPPLIVHRLERHEEEAPFLLPLLRWSLMPMLLEMAQGAKDARKREQELLDAMEDVADMLPPELIARARAEGVAPVDALLAAIFAPPDNPAGPHAEGQPHPQEVAI